MSKAKFLGIAAAILLVSGSALAQYPPPPQDPGYDGFYHERGDAPNYAAHWGYHDGFANGAHDRQTGHSFRPTQDSKYKHAPEYGHPPMSRNEYKNIYREAYLHGYERGYGR